MSYEYYIGIDPGVKGGIAFVDAGGEGSARKMPATERDMWDVIAGLETGSEFALIERLGQLPMKKVIDAASGRPIMVPKQSAKTTKVLYLNYGQLRMALTASGIPHDEVTPITWQKHFGLVRTNPNETDTAKKNRHKAKAQQLFPSLKITHAIADSLLIAEFCRRTHANPP